jgi:hypothetical protein
MPWYLIKRRDKFAFAFAACISIYSPKQSGHYCGPTWLKKENAGQLLVKFSSEK